MTLEWLMTPTHRGEEIIKEVYTLQDKTKSSYPIEVILEKGEGLKWSATVRVKSDIPVEERYHFFGIDSYIYALDYFNQFSRNLESRQKEIDEARDNMKDIEDRLN